MEARAGGKRECNMSFFIPMALMFFLIQFLVVLTIMVVALLLARPDLPLLGRETGPEALLRSFAFVLGLPRRACARVGRLARLIRSKLYMPVYRF
jgi:hypothetical protein